MAVKSTSLQVTADVEFCKEYCGKHCQDIWTVGRYACLYWLSVADQARTTH